MEQKEILQIQSQKLAYVGDAVHTLFVRNMFTKTHKGNVASLSRECNKFCNAAAQERAYFKFLKIATETEKKLQIVQEIVRFIILQKIFQLKVTDTQQRLKQLLVFCIFWMMPKDLNKF